ncbi:GatB/YqeY domain-containing protein [Listeria monocytogenes]
MTLLDKLNEDMKQAMRDKEKEKLSVIRMLKAALQNEAIHQGVKDLTPDDEVTVISRELKQRRDSLAEFDKAGRSDLSDKVRSEIVIVEDYAPKQLTPEELENIVKATIEEVGVSSKADFGKVMSAIMPKVKGKADGGAVNQFVKKYLS